MSSGCQPLISILRGFIASGHFYGPDRCAADHSPEIGPFHRHIVGQLEATLETTLGDALMIEIAALGVSLLVAFTVSLDFPGSSAPALPGKARHRHADAVVVVTQLLGMLWGITGGCHTAGCRFDEIGPDDRKPMAETIEMGVKSIERIVLPSCER